MVLKIGGPITFDLRSGVSYLDQVWFWAFYGFFGGSEVERWWKLNDLSDRSVSLWLNFSVHKWELFFKGVFSLGVSSDDEWCWISFLQLSFS